MKLKKIEVLGFKSFADKTVLNFHDGITGIVGPNGCGKSNISDAFRWVFGEQSAKSMRGEKMYDVIFAGTSTRKPLNYAEVTITFSEIDGYLPVDYEEIAVTRRIYRSGESEYLINRQPVRLKDIHSIFMDSGIGKDSFSIFEQGKIDQVINLSPQDRRYIFEEAAGISRFLQRKREALRKLKHTDQNLERVKDIHREVEKQIRVLERQAEKARLFKEDKQTLESLEKSLFVSRWGKLEKRYKSTFDSMTQTQSKVDDANKKLNMQLEQLKDAKEVLDQAQETLGERKEALFKARSEKEIQTKEQRSLKERLQELVAKEAEWTETLKEMEQKREERYEQVAALKEKQETVKLELEKQQQVRGEQSEKVKTLEEKVSDLRFQMQETQKRLIESMQKETQVEGEIRQISLRLEGFSERKDQHIEKQEKLSCDIESLDQEMYDVKAKQEHAEKEKGNRDQVLETLTQDLESIEQQLNETQKEKEELGQILTEQKARLNVLLRLKDEMEGFSSGTKKLLQETANKESPLYKKVTGLYEHISPKKGSEKAFSAVMKTYTQTLVTETQSDFDQVITYIKANNLNDCSLLCLEYISNNEKSETSEKHFLSQVTPSSVALHFLKDVNIADDTPAAFENPGAVWCQTNVFVDEKKVVFFTGPGEDNVFMREAEIKELEKSLEAKEKVYQGLIEKIEQLKEKRVKHQELIKEVTKERQEHEMLLREVTYTLTRLSKDIEQKKEELVQRKEAIGELERSTETLKVKQKELESQFETAKKEAQEIKESSQSASQKLDELMQVLKEEQSNLDQREERYLDVLQESRRLENDLHVFEVKDLESQEHEKRLKNEIEKGREQQEEIKEKDMSFETVLKDIDQTLIEVTEKCSDFEQEVQNKKEAIQSFEEKVEEFRVKRREVEDQFHKVDIQKTQIESQKTSLVEELSEFYNLTIEELVETHEPLEITFEEAEKKIRSLRRKMEVAGDINMTSIDEFEKLKERYEFLKQQIEDLEKSKEELLEIINQLDSESRKLFKETFDKIRENFQKNFKILFNGGEADLELTETPDILEAGVEIIAKPPGKQMRSISLMSGGEKCLTATALLFAIFEVKTSPFCILDEIDAPLDDTNVERFLKVVKQFIDKCQFIIITHNKRTMAMADRLFGVSMQEKGVSKLLAMTFSQDASPEPVLV